MYDIHCHILPGIDDGSGNTSDSIEMARLAAISGTKGIVATPHCNIPGLYQNLWDVTLEKKLSELQYELNSRNIPITIYSGQEICLTGDFLQYLRQGKLISINHSNYLLVEFDFLESAPVAYSKIQQIIAEGYIPVIAHPERYRFVAEQQDAIHRLKKLGGLIQVNKGSLKGRFGYDIMKISTEIFQKHQADFVASDAHSQYSRTPYLADIHELISERFSEDYADFLLKTNPFQLLNNKTIHNF